MINFPRAIDSTLLGTFRSCPQKFFREYLEHWKPKSPSVHLHAGGAYARGLEIARRSFYEAGLSSEESEARGLEALIQAYGDFECPPDSAKSLDRMCGALEFYFTRYPLDEDAATPLLLPNGRRAIEFTFALPLHESLIHPQTQEPILYCGRTDMIVDFAHGKYVLDDKTTSSLGPQWAKQWTLRSQFTGYAWAAKQVGIDVDGAIVRGVSILKSKYDTAQAMPNRSDFLIQRWYDQTVRDILSMIEMWKRYSIEERASEWSFNLDHACAEFGGCQFMRVCESPEPETWLPMYFERREWDPLSREETKLEEIK